MFIGNCRHKKVYLYQSHKKRSFCPKRGFTIGMGNKKNLL